LDHTAAVHKRRRGGRLLNSPDRPKRLQDANVALLQIVRYLDAIPHRQIKGIHSKAAQLGLHKVPAFKGSDVLDQIKARGARTASAKSDSRPNLVAANRS
jgi:hypothetical protein